MTTFDSFHFLRPAWLFALLLLVPLFWTALRSQGGSGAWRRVCDAQLLRHLTLDGGGRHSRTALVALAGAWSAACLALAGPTWERLPQPAFKEPVQTVLALNLAPSMNARDVAPTRLVRARYELLDVLERVEGAVGLVIFAEEPYPVTPLTDDPDVIASQVPLLEPSLMPGRGARVDRGIDAARELLTQAGAGQGRIVLLGDGLGDSPAAALDAAERAADAGFPVFVLGIGGDEAGLEALAESGGGRFAPVRADDSDLDLLLGSGGDSAALLARAEHSGVKADTWSDAGAWIVLLPLVLAPLAFRRGWAASLGLLAFVGTGPQVASAELTDWFARPDQQAAEALEGGDAARAAELFEDPEWRGAAQYRNGDFAASAETLRGRSDSRSQYNLGNAFARANQLEASIAAYDAVLESEPDHEDARFNRDLVEKLLQEQEKQQDQQQQGQEQSQQDQQQQGQEQSQQDQQQQGQEQSQDQASQDGDGSDAPDSEEGSQDEAASGSEEDSQQADAGSDPQESQASAESESTPEQQASAESESTPEQQATSEPQGDEEPREPAGKARADAAPSEGPEPDHRSAAAPGAGRELSERDQEVEQWLNRVPDDPGGLLREKLRRRYAERRYGANGGWR